MVTFIPVLIALGNKIAFFTIISPIIIFRFIHNSFKLKLKSNRTYKNILKLISTFCLTIYHMSFFAFYAIEIMMERNINYSEENLISIGFLSLFSILVGGIVEIFQFIIDFFVSIIKIIKNIKSIYSK